MRLIGIIRLQGEIEIITGLNIGAGDLEMRIGGLDKTTIRDPRSNEPYLPGSSLKGKIRSLLEWRSGAVQQGPVNLKTLELHRGKPAEAEVRRIIQLFGVSGDQNLDDETAKDIGPTRISVADARLIPDPQGSNLPLTEIKSENSIDRISGVAANPRFFERVAPGVKFRLDISIKHLEGDDDLLQMLLEGMKLLESDSLGGSGSRGYGKVRFARLTRDGEDIQAAFDSINPFQPQQRTASAA
ncbi:MAG: type III-A CRISPR-associated RAMP protein Csm3 [Phreatobacter sp.]